MSEEIVLSGLGAGVLNGLKGVADSPTDGLPGLSVSLNGLFDHLRSGVLTLGGLSETSQTTPASNENTAQNEVTSTGPKELADLVVHRIDPVILDYDTFSHGFE